MHLVQCLDPGSPFDYQALANVKYCLSGWLMKDHTSFLGLHEQGDESKQLPWYFGLLCWSYAIGGIVMLATRPQWTRNSKFPFLSFAWLLIFIQAPLSFTADYMHLMLRSDFHWIDRLLACPLMALEVCKIITMYPHTRSFFFATYCAATCFAVYSFLQSSAAQDAHDFERFVFWHNCWHVYPLLVAALQLFDTFVLADYGYVYSLSNNPNPNLLSSLLMEKTGTYSTRKPLQADVNVPEDSTGFSMLRRRGTRT